MLRYVNYYIKQIWMNESVKYDMAKVAKNLNGSPLKSSVICDYFDYKIKIYTTVFLIL